jgi:hypothetical protein
MKIAAEKLRLDRRAPTPFHSLVPARRRRRKPSSPELIGAGVLVVAVVALVSYALRRRLLQAVAVGAKAVEEVADAVEDAAEDLAEAAEARAKGDGPAE